MLGVTCKTTAELEGYHSDCLHLPGPAGVHTCGILVRSRETRGPHLWSRGTQADSTKDRTQSQTDWFCMEHRNLPIGDILPFCLF